MQIKSVSGSDERKLLIAMIVDKYFLAHMTEGWNKDGLFKTKWANLIGKWCVRYHKKYDSAPGRHIEHQFESWADRTRDKDTVKLVDRFLATLNDEYEAYQEEANTQYSLDVAKRYFNEIKLHRLVNNVQDSLDTHNAEKALSHVLTYDQLEVGLGEGVDVLNDKQALQTAIQLKFERVIEYPGDLNILMRSCMHRGGFVSFLGPEKRGKSYWLLDAAYRAVTQRKKVAYFEAGDNSQEEVIQRLASRVAKRPLKPGAIQYPISIEKDGDDTYASVETKTKRYKKELSWQKAWKEFQELCKRKIRSEHSYFKLSAHPNSSLSVFGIDTILKTWERQDWIPDTIIIDYADILKMDGYGVDGRDRINETWKHLRQLSQKWRALVLTATQAKADSYKKEEQNKIVMSKNDFSDDKRKLAHVTAMIGLNQHKEEEKDLGLMRLNFVVLRHGRFSERFCVHVAGCLDIANPAVKSCL